MRKETKTVRFGSETWVTVRATGEHAKVEAWSNIALAYRVRSRKRGLMFVTEEEVEDIVEHPEAHLGKHWPRCQAPACGAPLTPALALCPSCNAAICSCGRCKCVRASTAKTRIARKAVPKLARAKKAAKAAQA